MNLAVTHLSNEAFFSELISRQGLIPIAIDVEGRKIKWADMEQYHFYEGFFHKSVDTYLSLKNHIISFTTDLNILEEDRVVTDYIYPTGFIFHAGRCGSTLLAKTLARSRQNLVVSEASPLNQVWQVFTNDERQPSETGARNKYIYRNLLLAIARRRVASHRKCFIKFTSWNIHFFNFIHSAFPEVPAIFLTRETENIIASFKKRPPGWLNHKDPDAFKMLTGSHGNELPVIVHNMLQSASDQPVSFLKPIQYEMLKPENLRFILSCFNVDFDDAQLDMMKLQFAFDSKVEFNKKTFKA